MVVVSRVVLSRPHWRCARSLCKCAPNTSAAPKFPTDELGDIALAEELVFSPCGLVLERIPTDQASRLMDGSSNTTSGGPFAKSSRHGTTRLSTNSRRHEPIIPEHRSSAPASSEPATLPRGGLPGM